jgi:hypothetical protein
MTRAIFIRSLPGADKGPINAVIVEPRFQPVGREIPDEALRECRAISVRIRYENLGGVRTLVRTHQI